MVTRRTALSLAAVVLLASCRDSRSEAGVLDSVHEPFRREAPYELGPEDSCRWLEDGRLFVEVVWRRDTIRGVERMWIEFRPPAPPRVQVESWNEEIGTTSRWPRRRIHGRSWVSSDGVGLGTSDGPELTVDTDWTCRISGDPQRCGRRLHLRAEDLARTPPTVRSPKIADLRPSRQSFLDIEAVELEPGDTCRWLEDGRLFIEQVRDSRFHPEVQQVWIDFEPGRLPKVSACRWVADKELRPLGWGYILNGRSWVSSDGSGVGVIGGPDLIVELEFRVGSILDPEHFELALHVRSRSLVRAR